MDTLTPKQYQAITLLAAGYSAKETGQKLGVTAKCVEQWRKLKPDFKRLIREAQIQNYNASVAELVSQSQELSRELARIALDPETPTRTRITAIIAALNFAKSAKDSILEERLELLEKQVNGDYDTIETTAETLRNEYTEDETD